MGRAEPPHPLPRTSYPVNIEDIRDAVVNDRWHPSDHATEEAEDDQLSLGEIIASVVSGKIIEEYLDDRPYPSYLIYGITREGEPVHSVWGYNADTRRAVLVIVYRPDPSLWVDWRIRRPRGGGA